jgi:hypothetical protein
MSEEEGVKVTLEPRYLERGQCARDFECGCALAFGGAVGESGHSENVTFSKLKLN